MKNKKLKIEHVPISDLKEYENNAKLHPEFQIDQIVASILKFGFNDPIAVDENNVIIEGHGRLMALQKLGHETAPIIRLGHLTEEQKKAYILAHNKLTMNTGFDEELLKAELESIIDIDMADFGFELELDDVEEEPGTLEPYEKKAGSLADVFIAPPFSVIDAKQGYWRDRKAAWKSLGIKSDTSREGVEVYGDFGNEKYGRKPLPQVSIFDPALCELMYKWFNVDGGSIYDCFSGGSVRGIVAKKLGYSYTGIDVRQEQVDANYENAQELGLDGINWICDDSQNVDDYLKDNSVDMVFSCPPYADLEVYSELEHDISNKPYEEFLPLYRNIINRAVAKLKDDRFAVFVVGDVRDQKGFYYDFISDTKKAFEDAGAKLYNEIIFLQPMASAALRANRQFLGGRKVVKVNENILVFYKGDPKKIKENFKEIAVADLDSSDYADEF